MPVVFSGTLLITMVLMLDPTSVGKKTSGQYDMILPAELMPRGTIRSSTGLTTMLQQQQCQSQVPSQAYANYPMEPSLVSFSFRVEPPTNSWCHMLVSVMVFAFSFHIPMQLPCSLIVAHPLGFATLQPFRVYPWQAYVTFGNGLRFTHGVHWVASPPTALSLGNFMLLIQLSPSHSINMLGHTVLGAQ